MDDHRNIAQLNSCNYQHSLRWGMVVVFHCRNLGGPGSDSHRSLADIHRSRYRHDPDISHYTYSHPYWTDTHLEVISIKYRTLFAYETYYLFNILKNQTESSWGNRSSNQTRWELRHSSEIWGLRPAWFGTRVTSSIFLLLGSPQCYACLDWPWA